MAIDIVTMIVFAFVGYTFAPTSRSPFANRINVFLVVLILIASNIHGVYFGVEEVRFYLSAILEGLLGGMLIKRLAIVDAAPVRTA